MNKEATMSDKIKITSLEYILSQQSFEQASKRFTAACTNMRALLPSLPTRRFVTDVDGQSYLVTWNSEGDFECELVEVFTIKTVDYV
jgi:hypothetical protein